MISFFSYLFIYYKRRNSIATLTRDPQSLPLTIPLGGLRGGDGTPIVSTPRFAPTGAFCLLLRHNAAAEGKEGLPTAFAFQHSCDDRREREICINRLGQDGARLPMLDIPLAYVALCPHPRYSASTALCACI